MSFISQTLILPQLARVLASEATVLALVKPQFELQASDLGKGGIVRDASLYTRVESKIRTAYEASGFVVKNWLTSPIAGGDGNQEFFVHAQRV